VPDQQQRLVTDPVLGDHYYTQRTYAEMFASVDFVSHRIVVRQSNFQAFVLVP
jgi:hypothetical protein